MATQHTLHRAVYPGSFDLLTAGHVDVFKRSLRLFDEVILAVANNPRKKYFFDTETRMRLANEVVQEELTDDERARVRVEYTEREFIVDFAIRHDAGYIVRGLRGPAEFEEEYKSRLFNLEVSPTVEVLYLPTSPDLLVVSSSVMKESIVNRGWERVARKYLPAASLRGLQQRARELYGDDD
jgi:pantetheine-phosphate adenylyltransferase